MSLSLPEQQDGESGPAVPAYAGDVYQPSAPRKRRPARRRVVLPVVLFLLTCFTTFCAGACQWQPIPLTFNAWIRESIRVNWLEGLIFMTAVMSTLLAHEMGHFVAAVRHRVPVTLPFFIPMPVMMIGTMGAVIGMARGRADRRQIFDIGLAGPVAGLCLAVPLVAVGIYLAEASQYAVYGQPLLVKALTAVLRPDLAGLPIQPNACYMAGWVGLWITGLNMLPVSQLDGGHVSYALFGRRAHLLARTLLLVAVTLVLANDYYGWIPMLVIIMLLGVDHPPTTNDRTALGPWRWTLGLLSVAIPIVCFMPFPVLMD